MNSEAIFEKINGEIKEQILEVGDRCAAAHRHQGGPRTAAVGPDLYQRPVAIHALATISGVDLGENFEVIYHLSNDPPPSSCAF